MNHFHDAEHTFHGEALLRQALEALEAENKRLRDEVGRLRTDGASAVRWAPESAYWSEVLVELFGADARKGIDVLERRWQAALERAERLAEALRELEGREQRDEALLRQALNRLEAVVESFDPYIRDNECRPMENARSTIAALRERLYKGA